MTIHDIVKNFNTTPFLFAGSGLTRRYYGLPNWTGLLTHFAEQLRGDNFAFQYYENLALTAPEEERLPIIASLIERDFNEAWFSDLPNIRSEDEFVGCAVLNHVSPFKAEIACYIRNMSHPNEAYKREFDLLKQISGRNISGVITTNYDCFFEELFEGYKVFVGQNELIFSQLQGVGEIYKIHGSVSQPETIIINQSDYQQFYEKSKYLAAKLMTIFMEYPIVFLGYSISDPDIQAILSDIVECMPDDKVNLLQKRFVFVEHDRNAHDLTVANHSMLINGKVLEMTKIVLSDFSILYEALLNKKAAFPVRLLRRFKDELYSFALTSKPSATMQVAAIDDRRIDEDMLALTIGIAQTGLYGLGRAVTANHWYRNVVLHDSQYSIDDMLRVTYPELLKTNSNTLPVWYYITSASAPDDFALERAPKEYQLIVTEKQIERNKTAAAGRDALQIWEAEKYSFGRALRILVALPKDKINTDNLELILFEIFQEKPNILDEITNTNDKSNLKKLIRIYDFLRYAPK